MALSLLSNLRVPKSERELLEKCSVKELRRQAALKNVPLTHISAAVERPELINLIIRAPPIHDKYDFKIGVKVHSAESIAQAHKEHAERKARKAEARARKDDSKKKKKRRKSSSSSSSGSSSGSSSSSDHKKKKKKADKAPKTKPQEKRKKIRSRSPSLEMIAPKPAVPKQGTLAARRAARAAAKLKALPAPEEPAPPPAAEAERNTAQVGMAAAAAMGFNVLPKAAAPVAASPLPGLRPSLREPQHIAPAVGGSSMTATGQRVCVQYMCTNRCDLGAACTDAHITDPEEEMRIRSKFKEQECQLGANCTRPYCLYRHPSERLEEGRFGPGSGQKAMGYL